MMQGLHISGMVHNNSFVKQDLSIANKLSVFKICTNALIMVITWKEQHIIVFLMIAVLKGGYKPYCKTVIDKRTG